MDRKTIMGVDAPPPKPTRPTCAILIGAGSIAAVLLGLAADPLFRWILGLG
ncbi:MAG: hypothetical protein AAF718_01030 [Pseudomonadota bacterium]